MLGLLPGGFGALLHVDVVAISLFSLNLQLDLQLLVPIQGLSAASIPTPAASKLTLLTRWPMDLGMMTVSVTDLLPSIRLVHVCPRLETKLSTYAFPMFPRCEIPLHFRVPTCV